MIQGLEIVPSVSLGQVDFLAGKVTWSAYLPYAWVSLRAGQQAN